MKLCLYRLNTFIYQPHKYDLEYLSYYINYRFVEKYVEKNHDKPKKMNPILKTLKMHSPMDWEVLSEGTVMEDLNSDETKENLEECIMGH